MAFVRIVASCFIAMGSGLVLPLIGLVRRGVSEISNTRKQIPLILCLVGSLTLSLALPCGAGIYLVMGFSGNSFQLFDLLLVPHAPPPPPRSSHAYHHSNWKHCQFSNSPRLPIPLPLSRSFAKRENASTKSSIIILCAAWIYKRSNYERIIGKTDLLWKTVKLIDLAWIPGTADIPPPSSLLRKVYEYCKLITFKCSSHTQPHTHAQ